VTASVQLSLLEKKKTKKTVANPRGKVMKKRKEALQALLEGTRGRRTAKTAHG